MDHPPPNVNQIQVPPHSGPTRPSIAGQEIKAEFLQLKLLNKHAHLRVSPFPLDNKAFEFPVCLFAVATSKACFAAVIRTSAAQQFAIALGSLASLRHAFATGKAEENLIPYTPQKTFDCKGEKPVVLKFAANDDRLVVGFAQGPILVFDVNAFLNSDERPTPAVFPSEPSGYPRAIYPNPGDHPELVAVLRGIYGQDRGLYVEILDVVNQKLVGGWYSSANLDAMPVSVSWSPRGKQIAIGTHSGDLLLYSPQDTSMQALKGHVPRPANSSFDDCCAIATTWLANPTFYVVYAPPQAIARYDVESVDAPEQLHRIVQHDKNPANNGEIELENPCMPFGARRLPGPMSVVLKNWGSVKFLVFAGDGPASDIGALGCVGEQWGALALEETSRPALPLTTDMEESALFGLDVDLTADTPLDMSEQPGDDNPQLPPAPILMAYTSEGWLVAWHVIAQREGQYPGMVSVPGSSLMSTRPLTPPPAAAQPAPFSQSAPPAATPASASPFGAPQPTGAFGSATTAPAFGSTGFGGAAAPSFGSTGFGSTAKPAAAPASGSTFGGGGGGFAAFAGGNKPAAFGSTSAPGPSPFAAAAESKPATASTSPFGATSTPSAFGAATAKPTFGQTGFGFGQAPAAAAPAFGQTGFGSNQSSSHAPSPPAAPSSGGGFGAFANKPVSFGSNAASATSPPAAPSTGGFGAFAKPTSIAAAETSKPATTATPAFGQPSFGTPSAPTPTFGQSSFGFGQAKTPAAPTSTSGGFGAFASKPSSFGAPATTAASATTSAPASSTPTPPAAPVSTGLGAFTKPGSGFGAFGGAQGGDAKPSAFALAASGALQQTNSVAAVGFGKPTSIGLGKPPVTGSSAFGQTSSLGFGAKLPAVQEKPKDAPTSAPAGGGFAAFASNRTTSFGAPAPAGKGDTAGKDDAAKNVFGGASSKPTQQFTATGLGRALEKKDDDEDEDQAPKEAFPEDEIVDKDPTTKGDTAFGLGSLGIGLGKPSSAPGAAPSTTTPATTPAKDTTTPQPTPSKTPQTSPSKTPATPGAHGLFSSPASSSAFATPAKDDTTPTSSPSKTPATPASGFGAFGKSTSGFGAFANTTPIASAFSPSTTPKTETVPGTPTTPTPATPSATPGSVFGHSSIFGGGSAFGQPSSFGAGTKLSTPSASTGSAFSAFATPGKPSVFGQASSKGKEKEKDDAEDEDKPPNRPTLAKSPSLLDRMGPPPPSRIEPLPPDSDDDAEAYEGEYDDDLEDGDLPEDERGEEYDSEGEYELEEGEEEEPGDEEGEEDAEDGEDESAGHTGVFGKAPPPKAKSEEAPAQSAFKMSSLPSKPEPNKAASEPPSLGKGPPPKPASPTGENAPPKLFGLGRPSSAFGGAPARSSPLAAHPPVTADEEVDGPTKATQQKPLTNLSLPPKPTFSPFPGFTDGDKKSPTSPFLAAPTPVAASSLLGGARSGAPSPAPPASSAFPGLKPPFSLGPSPSPPPARAGPQPETPTQPYRPVPAETPLQQQFAEIYTQMTRELEMLAGEARKLTEQRAQIMTPHGGRTLQDLTNPDKWYMGDLVAFQQIIKGLDRETATLKDNAIDIAKSFAELQSLQLQAEVKREEMVRYAKANKDPEFKQMINVRGLGPEQEESQAKLRKQMQTVGDRIQQLEDVFESQRKRLEMHRTGRFRIEAPTLDTINRTCRNIDIALEQRAAEVARLATAVDGLHISPAVASPPRVKQEAKHARQASVAHAKAANNALAAEHSAARLKNLLSRARTEPVLSVASAAPAVQTLSQGTAAPPGPSAIALSRTPQTPPSSTSLGFFGQTNPGGSVFPQTPLPPLPAFNWPKSASPSPGIGAGGDESPLAARQGGGSGSRRKAVHSGSVKLPSATPSPTAAAQAAKTASFDWGPLKDFSTGKK